LPNSTGNYFHYLYCN